MICGDYALPLALAGSIHVTITTSEDYYKENPTNIDHAFVVSDAAASQVSMEGFIHSLPHRDDDN